MFEHRREIIIEWGDCDPAGIVFFPRYLAIFDACTWALGVELGYFFDGLGGEGARTPTQPQAFLELARSFIALLGRKHQDAACDLARAMADPTPWADAN